MTNEARAILDETVLGTLATVNEDGSPWATPVHVFADEEAVYWFSNLDKQHSLNVTHEPRVSVAVFSPDESNGPKGVYFNGSVRVLGQAEVDYAKQLVQARLGKIPAVFENAAAYRLQIGALNSSKSAGNCWYFYS